ncbi:DUF1541 domain-containing protein [Paenibacillus sp. Marseille-Q7038]
MKKQLALLSAAAIIVLGGCGSESAESSDPNTNQTPTEQNQTGQTGTEQNDTHQGDMNHSSSGEVPNGLEEAENPTYPVGSEVILKTDHMEGMNGAEATIVGAYETTAYEVSYTPTTGGESVNNHKWVIHEEIKDLTNETLKDGTEVTLEADHMPGMKDAPAVIDSSEMTTVYMVDYTPTTGGEPVKNHKWVTEEELSAK